MAALGASQTRAVLEVRSHDVPFLIEQGQTVCQLVYEPMADCLMPLWRCRFDVKLPVAGAASRKHFVQD